MTLIQLNKFCKKIDKDVHLRAIIDNSNRAICLPCLVELVCEKQSKLSENEGSGGSGRPMNEWGRHAVLANNVVPAILQNTMPRTSLLKI